MNVYVAGSTKDLRTVSSIAEALEDDGHRITFKWYDPNQEDSEIRTSQIDSKDLELVETPPAPHWLAERVDVNKNWLTTISHKPTGTTVTGSGYSKVQAHDDAIGLLRRELKLGWAENPEKARELARREFMAIADAEACVLVFDERILGAAIEVGAAMWNSDMWVFIYRPSRDSVFWYLPNVRLVWSTPELIDAINLTGDDILEIK